MHTMGIFLSRIFLPSGISSYYYAACPSQTLSPVCLSGGWITVRRWWWTGVGQVKILYVRNLLLSTSEETLENIFNQAAGHCSAVERVKKIKDYAFVHFHDRDDAMRALHVLNSTSYLALSLSSLEIAISGVVFLFTWSSIDRKLFWQ